VFELVTSHLLTINNDSVVVIFTPLCTCFLLLYR